MQAIALADDVSIQTLMTESAHIASQTEEQILEVVETKEADVQVGRPIALTEVAGVQTGPPLCVDMVDVACEAELKIDPNMAPPKERSTCSIGCQALVARCPVAVQTFRAQRCTVGAQAVPPPGIDCATQAEDTDALQREMEQDARLQELEAQLEKLTKQNEGLVAENKDANEKAKAFQHMAQTKAFGQMNVTILCPRAECTVSGERIEMDSWDPKRLREEFERDVLPRFSRVFVEESEPGSKGASRSNAVDAAMQDFAETFRERLSAMLSAPSAVAAVQAAAVAKSNRSGK
jgi:hypothetical protein